MPIEQAGREQLAFDRLRYGSAQEYRQTGEFGIANAAEYTKLPAAFSHPQDSNDLDSTGWNRLVENTLRALERVAPGVASQAPIDILLDGDRDERHLAFSKIRDWIATHPEAVRADKMLAFIDTLPRDLGQGIKRYSELNYVPGEGNERIHLLEAVALQLAIGRFPDMKTCLKDLSTMLVRPPGQKSYWNAWFQDRSEIGPFLAMVRAAMDMHLPRWKSEQDARSVQQLERGVSDMEWFFRNPLSSPADAATFERLFLASDILEGFVPSVGGTHIANVSWNVLLHELWFTPDRLQEQWMESSSTGWVGAFWRQDFQNDEMLQADLWELLAPLEAAFGAWKPEWTGAPWAVMASGDAIDKINRYEYELTQTEKGGRYIQVPDGPTVLAIKKLTREWIWKKTIEPTRAALERMVSLPDAAKRTAELGDGQYRSMMSYLLFLEGPGGRDGMVRYLNETEPRFADGAKANRSQDLMNGHVMKELAGSTRKSWSDAEKRAFAESSRDFSATRDLYVFSDVVHERNGGISLVEPSFNARLLSAVLNPEIARIAEAAREGEDIAKDLSKWTADAMRWMPDAHLFRDFFLENASHVGLFLELRKLFSAEELATDGIVLDVRTVDLRDHLDGKDDGVLKRAYMTTYPLVRVRGLEKAARKFPVDRKKAIADYLTDRAKRMTAATGEIYERMATELEIDSLRAEYRKMRDHLEPKDRALTNEQRVAAGQKAFDTVLRHVVARFPRATQHRDSILTSLMSDLATTGEQVTALEKMTYAYYVRHPGEQENASNEAFSATETVKNYLAMFQDRKSRRVVLSWFFGGPMPEDRLIEGEAFKVNEQEKVDAFWMLSGEERRAIFYSALLGEKGLFEHSPFSKDPKKELSPGSAEYELYRFVVDFYDDNFASLFPDARQNGAFRLAFVEAFTQYTPARRVELLLSLADRMRELKMSGEKLTAGEAIRLLLEQVGVVGVKTGQVLAEQKDALPEDMRSDLSSLKDRAAPFNKNGVFTYVRAAGWYEDGEGRSAVSEVGEIVGSASIKQVHRVRLESGEELAIKVQRPSIGRTFEEDMRVLGHVVDAFRRDGYDVPEWLLPEVRRVVEAEMDFGREARSSRTIAESLARRGASLSVGGRDLPLSVPPIRAIHTKETDPRRNMQLMMESFAHGLTLEDVRRLQEGENGNAIGSKAEGERDGIREKLRRLYGNVAPAMERRYAELDLQGVQAQLAVELLTQIAEGPMFHADLHRGNAIVNLSAGHEGISLIDLGSAGESKPEFLELSAHLLMLKQGMGSPERVAEILATYAPASLSPAEWTSLVTETVEAGETVEDVFKELLARLLKATGGTMDQNLRYLLKALASAGGHFQALQERVMTTAMNAAMAEGSTIESQRMAVLISPEVQKLLPLLPRVPFLAAMVGM